MKRTCTYPRGHNGACSDGRRRDGRCGLAKPARRRVFSRADEHTDAADRWLKAMGGAVRELSREAALGAADAYIREHKISAASLKAGLIKGAFVAAARREHDRIAADIGVDEDADFYRDQLPDVGDR